ncbi:DUF6185 family protein [Streptomyces sp. NPDC051315]|uniref:DUF6185 family protein n=1 Tax=Streptomyces sp. NPDC051315 TaxID=3365650 RepID=UPI0037B1B8CF
MTSGATRRAPARLLVVLLAFLVLPHVAAAPASAAPDDPCDPRGLSKAVVEAGLRLEHDDRTYTKVLTELTVEVPLTWSLAGHLLHDHDSERYRHAMRCLVRGDVRGLWTNWHEWRSGEPAITPVPATSGGKAAQARALKVVATAHGWVDQRGTREIGPWTIEAGRATWLVRLDPPDTLTHARWRLVTVEPGSAGAVSAEKNVTVGESADVLAWRPTGSGAAPEVTVRMAPAWPRSFSAQDDNPPFAALGEAGGLLWSLLLVVATWCALILLPRHGVPDPVEERTRANLRDWSWVLLALSLLVTGRSLYLGATGAFEADEEWAQQAVHAPWAWLTAVATGGLLLAFGRPSPRVGLAGVRLAAVALVPVLWPAPFHLEPQRFVRDDVPAPAVSALVAVCLAAFCSVTLLVLGSALAVRRLAVDGGLYSPRRPAPRTWTLLGGTVAVVVVLAVCCAAAAERDWNRASWLSPQIDAGEAGYGFGHHAEFRSSLLWFTHQVQNWWCAMAWLPSGLAVLALLRGRGSRTADEPVERRGPHGADRLLLLLLFPVMVALNIGEYTGSGTLTWIWFLLYLLAPVAVLRIGSGRAVGDRSLQRSGEPLGRTLRVTDRATLLDRSRSHRELHARLRRLDQGQPDEGDGPRRALESRLERLRRWRSSSGADDRLPHGVSVVDAALALGPGRTWWENGVRAARFTQPVSLPISAGLVWAHQLSGESLTGTLYDRLGLPDVPTQFVLWQVGYAAAGFVLGALWHELPGRRGAAKAFPLAVAYALPAGLFALGNWALGEEQTGLAFAVAAMTLVLTVTGILMDLETFSGERHLWRSRVSLLYSVYQMRFLSIQVAWLLAQAAAVVTIWQFFVEDGGSPPQNTGGGGR